MNRMIPGPIIVLLLIGCSARLTDSKKLLLKNELEEMVRTDQVAASIPQGKYKAYAKDQWQQLKDSVFTSDNAYLYDRVKVNAGEKQLFGTQVTYEVATTGRAVPKIGLTDSANLDQRRKDYGLEPLKSYLNTMTAAHYEMNKEHYQKMGITEPNLY